MLRALSDLVYKTSHVSYKQNDLATNLRSFYSFHCLSSQRLFLFPYFVITSISLVFCSYLPVRMSHCAASCTFPLPDSDHPPSTWRAASWWVCTNFDQIQLFTPLWFSILSHPLYHSTNYLNDGRRVGMRTQINSNPKAIPSPHNHRAFSSLVPSRAVLWLLNIIIILQLFIVFVTTIILQ